jgi:predicted NAD/FAD-dependent oxidoreductase
VHASVPWTLARLSEGGPAAAHASAGAELLQRLRSNPRLMPSLSAHAPLATKTMLWLYSQVRDGAAPDEGALLLGGEGTRWPPLLVAGDGVTGSNFDNCIFSGTRAAERLHALHA